MSGIIRINVVARGLPRPTRHFAEQPPHTRTYLNPDRQAARNNGSLYNHRSSFRCSPVGRQRRRRTGISGTAEAVCSPFDVLADRIRTPGAEAASKAYLPSYHAKR